jgi:hypothetical protein
MKSKYIVPVVIVSAMMLVGCASVNKGRFSAFDLDLRTPEQVVAQVPEKTCIYADSNTNKPPTQVAEAPRAFPFELLFQFLQIMKGRIQILSLEWKTDKD